MGPVDTPTRIKWGISTWFAVGLLLTALAASPRAWGAEELQPILLTGSATYSVPIVVPPGTNGIQPNLSLVYNSDMGNDAIGQGWDLAGLGYVERLGPNYSPAPTYFGNDTYRLNFGGGSYKLVSTGTDSSGTTTYRTEIDSHLRIQHFDDYWVVTDQGGTQYFFGQNFYSQQRTNQNSVTNQEEPFLWYLDQVIDAHQTSMTVEYNFLGALSQGSRRYRNHVREILYSQGPTLLCSPSSRANCRSVKFLYEGREDDLFDYRSGAETVTWNRLQAIEVKLGSQLVRKYVLGYDPSPVTARGLAPVSQLTSITEYGPGGANLLPPRKFAYHVDGNKDNLDLAAINMGNPPPFELSYCSLVADMNNDGLIDVVTTTISNDNPMYVQENQDGQSFKSQVSIPGQYPTFCPIEFVPVTINVPVTHTYTARDDYGQPMTHVVTGSGAQVDWIPVVTRAHDLVVLDFDGDGLPDLLYGHTAQSSGWGWWRNLGNNVFSPKQSVTNPPAFVLNEAGVRYADMDQDGLIDIVRLENLGGSDSTGTWTFKLSWWRNLGRDSSTNALQFSQTATILNNLQIYVTYPQGKGLTPFDQFAVFQANMMSILNLLDMNRDGMPDLVWPAVESLSSGTATMRYYYYPLNGRSAGALVTMSPGLVVETTVKYPFVELNRLADMNGDGWPDLLSGIPNNYSYYPGQGGNGTFGAKVTLGQSPSRYLTSSNDVNSFVNNMMLTDMNGDGFIDILQGDASAYRSYRMTMTDNHQKLETVTTPMGGFMTGAYQNLRDNGINKWVLRQITHNNGLGQSWAEDFSYAGAKRTYWPKNEFRGYRTVTATDPPDHNGLRHTTTTMFNQEDVKKGRVEKIEIAGAPAISGDPPPPFSATTYAYQETQNSPAQGVHQVNLTSETVVTYDGDAATSKTSQTTYANFDAYGHPRSVTKSGTGTASRIVTTSYLENADAYIVNRPASTVTTIGGVNVNATWFSYDDLAEGIKPSKGDVTQERYYLSGAPASDYPVVTHVYDYAGNLLGHIDAKENLCPITRPTGFWFGLYTTKIDYDDLFKAFQVAEYNALCQSMTMNYWGLNTTLTIPTTGPLAGAVAVPGLLATVADPNGVKTDTYYDDLGRPKGTVTPPDSTDAPTTLWSYTNFIDTDTDGNPATPLVRTPASTKQSRRESTSSTLDRYTYIDGFGRVVQTKREAENGQWITTDTFYNTRGLVESVSIPYLTAGSAYSQPDTTKPKTRTLYDVMRRPIEVQNPDHSTSSPNKRMIQYQDWVVTETNEKGIATVREFDALGRLIRVTEPSPGGTTLYRYDNVSSAGHTIQKITDAQNNVTTMWFDTLGRKVASSDPDMGGCGDLTVVAPANFSLLMFPAPCWNYDYDKNGNLLRQSDAKGKWLVFTYDKLNRVTSKTVITPPNPPTGLVATAVSPNQVSLAWVPPAGFTTGYKFEVERASSSTGPFTHLSPDPTGNDFTDNSTEGNTAYYYRVRTIDPAGTPSVYSNVASLITPPARPTLTITRIGDGTVTATNPAGGINCGTDCAEVYPGGTQVTLSAVPGSGSVFTGWNGLTTIATWGGATLLGSVSHNGMAPQIATDQGGNIIVVWRASSGLLANRYVTGTGWGTAVVLDSSTSVSDGRLAMDSNGNALVMWTRGSSTTAQKWAARYTVGAGWGTSIAIDTQLGNMGTPGASGSFLVMNNSGNGIAVWVRDNNGGSPYTIWASRYTVGTGWSAAVAAGTSTVGPNSLHASIGSAGHAAVVWRRGSLRVGAGFSPSGTNWSTATIIDNGSSSVSDPQVAVDGSGNALAVWSQGTGVWSSLYQAGTGWSSAILVENIGTGPAQVAMDGNGIAVVTGWTYDSVNGTYSLSAKQYKVGTGWGTVASIQVGSSPGSPVGFSWPSPPSINGSGVFPVAWLQGDSVSADLWAVRYVVNAGWGSPALLERNVTSAFCCLTPQLTVTESGEVIATWMPAPSATSFNIMVDRYTISTVPDDDCADGMVMMIFDRTCTATFTSTAGPVISNIAHSNITVNGATITWTTDQITDSVVRYGPTTGYGSTGVTPGPLSTAHSVTLTGLLPGTTYHYQVVSTNAASVSTSSPDRFFTTLADTIPPQAPTGLTATAVSGTQIKLSWTAAPDNGVIAGYRIERCQGSLTCTVYTELTTIWAYKGYATPWISYSDAGLTPGTAYRYQVWAVDTAGLVGPRSAPAATTTPAATPIRTQAWAVNFNGPTNGDDSTYGRQRVAMDASGFVYVTGWSWRNTAPAGAEVVTVKYSPSGVKQPGWEVRLDTGLTDPIYDLTAVNLQLVVDPAGNVYIATKVCSTGCTNTDIKVVKYNTNGILQWSSPPYDNGGYDAPQGMAIDAEGNVYITGYSFNASDTDAVTIKYGPNGGAPLWVARYHYAGNDEGASVAVDAVGNVYVTGGSCADAACFGPGSHSWDAITIKYGSHGGNPLWVTRYDNGNHDYTTGVVLDGGGNLYVTGHSCGVATLPPGTFGCPNFDYLTIKYGPAGGDPLWVKRYDNGGDDYDGGIPLLDGSGNVYVTGSSMNGLNTDYATIKYNAAGDQLWVKRYDSGDGDRPVSLTVDTSGNAYVTGYSFGAGGSSESLIVKYAPDGTERWVARYAGGNFTALTLDQAGALYVAGESSNVTNTDYLIAKYMTTVPAAPTGLAATATGGSVVALTWTASMDFSAGYTYEVERSPDGVTYAKVGASTTATSFTDNFGVAGDTSYVYRVRTVDGAGRISDYSNRDLATTVIFQDDSTVRAVHVTQLRTAVNAVRRLSGLIDAGWLDAITPCVIATPSTCFRLKAAHVQEVRDRLQEAFQMPRLQGVRAPNYTVPLITSGTTVRKTDIDQMRNAVK